MGGTTNYTQHVRVDSDLQLTTRNLPDIVKHARLKNYTVTHVMQYAQVPGYSYMCRIGNAMVRAVRNNETSLTCQVDTDEVGIVCVVHT